MAVVVPAVAQVYNIDTHAKKPIVRTMDGQFTVIYNELGNPANEMIVMVDNMVPISVELPAWLTIRDMEVASPYVYFCGTTGTHGVVGRMDVFQAWMGNPQMYCAFSDACSDNPYCYATNFKKLDVFVDSGKVQLALVGDFIEDVINHDKRSSVAWAWCDSTYWYFSYYYNKDGWVKFTDIACLDDVIVAVGNDSTDHDCYVKTFKKQSRFTKKPLDSTFVSRVVSLGEVGEPLVVHTGDNMAVVAQFSDAKVSTVLHRLHINPTTGIPVQYAPTTFNAWFSSTPFDPTVWQMKDLRYNSTADSLYLLEYAEYMEMPGVMPWIIRFPNIQVPTVSIMEGIYKFVDNPMSMDMKWEHPCTAGESTIVGGLFYTPNQLQSMDNCHQQKLIKFTHTGATIMQGHITEDNVDCVRPGYNMTLNINPLSEKIECE